MAAVATRTPNTSTPETKRGGLTRMLSRSQSSRKVVVKNNNLSSRSLDGTRHKVYGSISNETVSTSAASSFTSLAPTHNKKSALRKTGKRYSKKSVRFGNILIREHAIEPTNNPSVTGGAALGLSWLYTDLPKCGVAQYEASRTRRTQAEFQVPKAVREQMLRNSGYSKKELMEVTKQINIARKQRRASVMSQEVEDLHVAVEWVGRKFKKAVTGGSKKEEEKLWANANKAAAAPKRQLSRTKSASRLETAKPRMVEVKRANAADQDSDSDECAC